MSTTAAALVALAQQDVESLSPSEFANEIASGHAVVVDLREPQERADTGSIHGAIGIPRRMLEFRADPTHPLADAQLSPDRRVLLYCASGGRSALGAVALAELGYDNVAHLAGGITAWVAAGGPVVARQHQPY